MVIGSPVWWTFLFPSMKVPPKRKGNWCTVGAFHVPTLALNESPSEKEGKFPVFRE